MNQTLHSYGILMKAFKILFSCFGFFFPVIIIGRMYLNSPERLMEIFSDGTLLYRFITFVITYWIFLLPATLIAAYFHSDIVANAEGLVVEFLWMKLGVRWHEIVEVKPSFRWGLPTFGPKFPIIVLTKALTPFHRVFGLLYGRSSLPAFVINPTIGDYDLLVQRIQSNWKKDILE